MLGKFLTSARLPYSRGFVPEAMTRVAIGMERSVNDPIRPNQYPTRSRLPNPRRVVQRSGNDAAAAVDAE